MELRRIYFFSKLHFLKHFIYLNYIKHFCPGKAALGIIVVSLPYTAYHWGSLIVLCEIRFN